MIDAKLTEEVWRGPLRWMICSAMPHTQVAGWELFHSINDFAFGWKVWKPKSLESMCWFKWFECVTIGDFTAFYSVLFDVYFFWGGLVQKLHSPKPTWHLKIDSWKRRFVLETLFFFQGSMLVFGGVSGIFCFFLIPEFKVESRCGAAGAAFGGIVHFEKLVGRPGLEFLARIAAKSRSFLGLRVNVWSKMD